MRGRDVLNAEDERLTTLFYAGFGIYTEFSRDRWHSRDYSVMFPRENMLGSRENRLGLNQYRLTHSYTLINRRQKVRHRLDIHFSR